MMMKIYLNEGLIISYLDEGIYGINVFEPNSCYLNGSKYEARIGNLTKRMPQSSGIALFKE
ncbi:MULTISPECIES: hypothetical protein [Cytobacillus]|uniref:hypothetical protein n=1 Tax=Cytobacillus TaxID=2675230 RepID=UPI0020403687|nr:hypothetical protein [Cytobacillus firmus]